MKNRIKFGEIKPNGWLKKELEENMEGCIGHLDALVPHLIREHDIYGKERLGQHSRLKDLGRNDSCSPEFEGHEDQFIWWNSETQSNWRDGFVRSTMLLDNETYKKQTEAYVEEILKTQEKFYLADPALRYSVLGYSPDSVAAMLENVIYLELLRRGYDVYVGKLDNAEIDFIAVKQENKVYIQAAQKIGSPETERREYGRLLDIRDNYPKYVLQTDAFAGGNYEGIKTMHIADFLLSDEY